MEIVLNRYNQFQSNQIRGKNYVNRELFAAEGIPTDFRLEKHTKTDI